MQFNSETNNQDLISEIHSLCDSDSTSYPINPMTRRINSALEDFVGKIINVDGTWEYDDTNYTDLPVGTADLVEGQESYTFASEYLKIKRMKVKTLQNKWRTLRQIDQQDFEKSWIP